MEDMSTVIAIASGKGGVGRTALTFNLGVGMSLFGRNVVMMDLDLVMANMDVVTGLLNPNVTLHDVLAKNLSIEDCVYEIKQGVQVVPTGIHFGTLRQINSKYISWNKILEEILEYGDIFLMDIPAGINSSIFEGLPENVEMVIVTNSTMMSVANALKIRILSNDLNIPIIGFVLNMWYDDGFLLSVNEIESILEVPVIGIIPYDREVERSIALGKSLVETNPSSPTSNAIMQLAAHLLGEEYNPIEPDKKGVISKLLEILLGGSA